jgi:hypothetical protein
MRSLDFAPLLVAVLAPATALYHIGLGGTHSCLVHRLPSLGLEYAMTCIGVADGPPGLKAAFLIERFAQALVGQCLCAIFLLLVLLAVPLPSQDARRRAARVHVALATLLVSTVSFSTWIMAGVLSLLAQDF